MTDNRDSSIDYMKVRTRGNSNPRGKNRVYFTCHPADFDKYFDRVCEDIFTTQDCAIYYTADMTAPIPAEYRETDLGSMNLFVIPITRRLLSEQSRAMDEDFAFAEEKHSAVLPLMMESGIDKFYADRFGNRQYLCPDSKDLTEISYEKKLKDYLAGILIDDETAARVRAAFDACIFLSYRKKDRHHANELMRLIHQNPKYRDIAIWYDEYLTPGEDFEEIIGKALEKSNLFTLLVTPNLVNEKNYVQEHEYPAAHDSGKPILPAEVVQTNRAELERQYKNIPPCVDGHDNAALVEALKQVAVAENDEDPEHNYLIGLAYLEGIDVEVNVDRGVELITGAAECGYEPAYIKLHKMYSEGIYVQRDVENAYKWANKMKEANPLSFIQELDGVYKPMMLLTQVTDELTDAEKEGRREELEQHQRNFWATMLKPHNTAAIAAEEAGKIEEAIALHRENYKLAREHAGENHKTTLLYARNLAVALDKNGDRREARELLQEAYKKSLAQYGKDDVDTLSLQSLLGKTHARRGQFEKALQMCEEAYTALRTQVGDLDAETLEAQENLGVVLYKMGRCDEAAQHFKNVYYGLEKTKGREYYDMPRLLEWWGAVCEVSENKEGWIESYKIYYECLCKQYGEPSEETIDWLIKWAERYIKAKEWWEACQMGLKAESLLDSLYSPVSTEYLRYFIEICDIYEKSLKAEKRIFRRARYGFNRSLPEAIKAAVTMSLISYKCMSNEELTQKACKKVCKLHIKLLERKDYAGEPNSIERIKAENMFCLAALGENDLDAKKVQDMLLKWQ